MVRHRNIGCHHRQELGDRWSGGYVAARRYPIAADKDSHTTQSVQVLPPISSRSEPSCNIVPIHALKICTPVKVYFEAANLIFTQVSLERNCSKGERIGLRS